VPGREVLKELVEFRKALRAQRHLDPAATRAGHVQKEVQKQD